MPTTRPRKTSARGANEEREGARTGRGEEGRRRREGKEASEVVPCVQVTLRLSKMARPSAYFDLPVSAEHMASQCSTYGQSVQNIWMIIRERVRKRI